MTIVLCLIITALIMLILDKIAFVIFKLGLKISTYLTEGKLNKTLDAHLS